MMTERFDRALVLASGLHRDQRRKGSGAPYVSHLLAVAAIVIEQGGDEDQAIAALLHDAVEDQGGLATRDRIEAEFGPEVARLVMICTDSAVEPKPPWRPRKEAYLANLRRADDRARLISCADKLHNARSILHDLRALGDDLWPRFTGGRDGSLWYYRALAEVFLETGPRALAGELDRVVGEIGRLSEAGAR